MNSKISKLIQDERNQEQPWYAVRSVFYDEQNKLFEERTILIRAKSHQEAIEIAEQEAADYCESLGYKYIGYSDTFHLFDQTVEDRTEIFSITRNTDVSVDEYLDRFLDSGNENRMKWKDSNGA